MIAQDVEKVYPELVRTSWRGHKQVSYVGLIGPLIEAVKELDQRLGEVERRLGLDSAVPPGQDEHAGP